MTQERKDITIEQREDTDTIDIVFDLHNWINEDCYWREGGDPWGEASEAVRDHLETLIKKFNPEWEKTAHITVGSHTNPLRMHDYIDIDVEADVACGWHEHSKATVTITTISDTSDRNWIAHRWAQDFVDYYHKDGYTLNEVAGETLVNYMIDWPYDGMDSDHIEHVFTAMEEDGYYYDYKDGLTKKEDADSHTRWRHENRVLTDEQDCKLMQFLNKKPMNQKA